MSLICIEQLVFPRVCIISFKCESQNIITRADPIKLFFLCFPIFAVKLGHCIVDTFLSYVPNAQGYQRKTENFFASEEKEFYRISYCFAFPFLIFTVLDFSRILSDFSVSMLASPLLPFSSQTMWSNWWCRLLGNAQRTNHGNVSFH